jgi:hypothetical protein
MIARLSDHLTHMATSSEMLWLSIKAAGSDEQRQLVSAMRHAVVSATSHFQKPVPDGRGEDFFMWRHEAIRPVSLCVNSAELLLTDEDHPLDADQCASAQAILETALVITALLNDMFDQRLLS